MSKRPGPRVLLLGATGMLGSHLAQRLPARFPTWVPALRAGAAASASDAHRLSRALDATDPESVEAVIADADPDVVINCIAVTPASPLAQDAPTVIAVNCLFPHQLAALLRTGRRRLIHISTDGVFSGAKGGYREEDIPDPTDFYGRSKVVGEVDGPGCLTIRTSFFGRSPKGHGLIEWLIAQQGRSIEGYADYVFSGIAAPVLADLIGDVVAGGPSLEGVLHIGGPPISKYDLLTEAARALEIDVRIAPVRKGAIDRSLDSSRFSRAVKRAVPSLREMALSLTAKLQGAPRYA